MFESNTERLEFENHISSFVFKKEEKKNEEYISSSGYHLVNRALQTKEGTLFGKKPEPYLLIRFGCSEKEIKNIIAKHLINPNRLVSYDQLLDDEKSYNEWEWAGPKYDLKNSQFFERKDELKMIEHLRKLNFTFDDGSTPTLTDDELEQWLVFPESEIEREKIIDFFKRYHRDSFRYYAILTGRLETKDGQVFGERGKKTHLFMIYSSFFYIFQELIKIKAIKTKNMIQLKDIKDKHFDHSKAYRHELKNLLIISDINLYPAGHFSPETMKKYYREEEKLKKGIPWRSLLNPS